MCHQLDDRLVTHFFLIHFYSVAMIPEPSNTNMVIISAIPIRFSSAVTIPMAARTIAEMMAAITVSVTIAALSMVNVSEVFSIPANDI